MKKIIWPLILTIFFLILAYGRIAEANLEVGMNFFLFSIIIFYSAFRVFNDKYAYSLNLFFWIFNLVFMGYISSFQYILNSFPWVQEIDDEKVFETNCILLLSLVSYDLIYRNYKVKEERVRKIFEITYNKFSFYGVGLGIYIICWILTVYIVGIQFTRYDLASATGEINARQDQALVVTIVLRSIILFYCVLCVHFFRTGKIPTWFFLLILTLSILVSFPTAVSRNYAGIFYFGLLFNYFRVFRQNLIRVVPITFILALNILFPLLTFSRFEYFNLDYVLNNFSKITSTAFMSGDFDAYSMLAQANQYVEQYGTTDGKQLLGALLFFVPRSMWPDKPFGSGYFIGEKFGFSFLNVSCPIHAEGLINFGIIGVIIFMIALGILFKRFDTFYWRRVSRKDWGNLWIVLYPSLLGSFFFIFRGDLLSSGAYTIGLLISVFIFHLILKMRFSK